MFYLYQENQQTLETRSFVWAECVFKEVAIFYAFQRMSQSEIITEYSLSPG